VLLGLGKEVAGRFESLSLKFIVDLAAGKGKAIILVKGF
jgi:hypothetical protein